MPWKSNVILLISPCPLRGKCQDSDWNTAAPQFENHCPRQVLEFLWVAWSESVSDSFLGSGPVNSNLRLAFHLGVTVLLENGFSLACTLLIHSLFSQFSVSYSHSPLQFSLREIMQKSDKVADIPFWKAQQWQIDAQLWFCAIHLFCERKKIC